MPIAGRFITFEGGEGAGKSTQLARLAERLRADGATVLGLREPGGTPYGERMRDVLKQPGTSLAPAAEALLFASCRAQLVADVIAPALAAGQVVICDRFIDSTVAYQGGGKGVAPGLIEAMRKIVHPDLQPDCTLIFDCAFEVSQERMQRSGRALDRFEREGRAFFERVRAAYLAVAKADPGRVRVIDSTHSLDAIRTELRGILAGL